MTSESVAIVLPLPNKVLSINWMCGTLRGRYYRASATRKYRQLAKEAVEAEHIETAPWLKVKVSVEFYWKTNRKHDEDNAMGSLKAVYDGIVDSGLVIDDDSKHMQREIPAFHLDRNCPRVVLTLLRQ